MMEQAERRLSRATGVVALGVLSSRILGFIREMIFAGLLGAGWIADAFYVAYRIPNMLRELLAEGSMSAGFIPVFTESLKRSPSEARNLARTTGTLLALILAVVVGVGMIFAPQMVSLMAPGFVDYPAQFSLAISLTRWMFPFLLFIAFSALSMGILNSMGRFGPPAFSQSIFNIVSIVCMLTLVPVEPVYAAAMGVLFGGLAQWLIQVPALWKEGFQPVLQRPLWPPPPAIVQMGQLILPTVLGLSVVQINLFVNTLLASTLSKGSVSYLYYSMRLIHLPLGLFAVALSTALLPTLSMQVASDEISELRHTAALALRMIFFVTIPAMIGLIALRRPIIHVLFEHGAFDTIATLGTANALLYYAMGLCAFAGIRILAPVFYALKDTRTPVKMASAALCVNIVLCVLLIAPLGYRGLALSTSLSALLNFSGLFLMLRHRLGSFEGLQTLRCGLQAVVLSILSTLPAFYVSFLPVWQTRGAWVYKTFLLFLILSISAATYVAAQLLLKSEEGHVLYHKFTQRGPPRS